MNEEVFLIGGGQIQRITGQRGETPDCKNAEFKRGDVVRLRNKKSLKHLPRKAVVAVAVPPGFSPDYAMADLLGEPRPLMSQVGARCITYILVRENDPKPYLLRESDLLATGTSVEIGTISSTATPSPQEKA